MTRPMVTKPRYDCTYNTCKKTAFLSFLTNRRFESVQLVMIIKCFIQSKSKIKYNTYK